MALTHGEREFRSVACVVLSKCQKMQQVSLHATRGCIYSWELTHMRSRPEDVDILAKNMLLVSPFNDKLYCGIFWPLKWHHTSSLETCFSSLFGVLGLNKLPMGGIISLDETQERVCRSENNQGLHWVINGWNSVLSEPALYKIELFVERHHELFWFNWKKCEH